MKTADGYPVVCYGVKGKYNIHRICRRCKITKNKQYHGTENKGL